MHTKMYQDSRYALTVLEIVDVNYSLCTYYSPKINVFTFYTQLTQKLLEHNLPNLIVTADFNATDDPFLDHSNTHSHAVYASSTYWLIPL